MPGGRGFPGYLHPQTTIPWGGKSYFAVFLGCLSQTTIWLMLAEIRRINPDTPFLLPHFCHTLLASHLWSTLTHCSCWLYTCGSHCGSHIRLIEHWRFNLFQIHTATHTTTVLTHCHPQYYLLSVTHTVIEWIAHQRKLKGTFFKFTLQTTHIILEWIAQSRGCLSRGTFFKSCLGPYWGDRVLKFGAEYWMFWRLR